MGGRGEGGRGEERAVPFWREILGDLGWSESEKLLAWTPSPWRELTGASMTVVASRFVGFGRIRNREYTGDAAVCI